MLLQRLGSHQHVKAWTLLKRCACFLGWQGRYRFMDLAVNEANLQFLVMNAPQFKSEILSWYLACPFSPYPPDIWTLKQNHESGRASSVGWYEAHLFGPNLEVTWGGMDAYPLPRIVPKTSDKHGGFLQDDCQGTTSLKMEKTHSLVIQLSYMFTNKYMYIYIIYTRYHPCMVYIYTYMNFVDFYGWLM